MTPPKPIQAILDALASQQRQGETSLIVKLEPDLIPAAMDALRGYRKMFAPVIPGLTDTSPIYAAYERMRQADAARHTILLLVECQSMQEFNDAIGRMPMRHSSEWRSFSTEGPVGPRSSPKRGQTELTPFQKPKKVPVRSDPFFDKWRTLRKWCIHRVAVHFSPSNSGARGRFGAVSPIHVTAPVPAALTPRQIVFGPSSWLRGGLRGGSDILKKGTERSDPFLAFEKG